MGKRKIAIIYEQTDYARPIAERMEEKFLEDGGEVVFIEAYLPTETDFRTIISKAISRNPDSIFLSTQRPEASFQLVKNIKEFGLDVQLFGNDAVVLKGMFGENPEIQEGIIGAGPNYDKNNPKTKAFTEKFLKRFEMDSLPYGFYTAESYDGMFMLKEAIEAVGEDPEKVKDYLYTIEYHGASGTIKLDEHGDGIREYILKIVKDGELVPYEVA